MDIVCFLQNAWSPHYAGREWPRKSWLKALEKSRSGQRLKHLLDDFACCHNITPEVSSSPDICLAPSPFHIHAILESDPDIIIACGRIAENAIASLWHGRLIVVPHPASRVLTNNLYNTAREYINYMTRGSGPVRRAFRQGRSGVLIENIPYDVVV